jgi:hypothetical protein
MMRKFAIGLPMLTAAVLVSSVATWAQTAGDHGWSSWRAGETQRGKKTASYGAKCAASVTSRGEGSVGLGLTQFWAQRHTTRNWMEAVTKLEGAEYSAWSRAKGKSVSCTKSKDGKEWACKATATPCKA